MSLLDRRGAVAAAPGHSQARARQATRGEPKPPGESSGVAGEMGRPAPDPEAPTFGWLVLVGAIFGLGVLKEALRRIGGPVIVTVKSFPRLPLSLLIAGAAGGLGRIGARVLGFRSGL